jgi:hypothetical protein
MKKDNKAGQFSLGYQKKSKLGLKVHPKMLLKKAIKSLKVMKYSTTDKRKNNSKL